jgi:hypothetical protein
MNLHNLTGMDVDEGLRVVGVVCTLGLLMMGTICCCLQFRRIC